MFLVTTASVGKVTTAGEDHYLAVIIKYYNYYRRTCRNNYLLQSAPPEEYCLLFCIVEVDFCIFCLSKLLTQ